jgi:hypothetical protein
MAEVVIEFHRIGWRKDRVFLSAIEMRTYLINTLNAKRVDKQPIKSIFKIKKEGIISFP